MLFAAGFDYRCSRSGVLEGDCKIVQVEKFGWSAFGQRVYAL
jgi:hypothetical protein